MNNIFAAIWAEGLKIRRSKIFLITVLAFMLIPMMMGVLIFVAKNPELAYKFGLLGAKASVLKLKADWPTYLGLVNTAVVGLGSVGFGFVTSWVFGREFSDRTVKDLLALPVSRATIVLSKFTVVAIWCVLLSFLFVVFGLLAGGAVGLDGWSIGLLINDISIFATVAFLVILLCAPVAFFAGLGRGYLAPVGFVVLALVLSQFVGALGLAQYFPWAVPMLYTGAAGAESAQLGMTSFVILYFTSALGLIGTLAWWRFADQY